MKSQDPTNLAGNLSCAVTKEALTDKEFNLLFQEFEENNIPDWWDFSNLELLRFLLLLSIPDVPRHCNNQLWKQQRGACGKYREVWTAAETHQTDTFPCMFQQLSPTTQRQLIWDISEVPAGLIPTFSIQGISPNRIICPCSVKLDIPNRSQFLSSCCVGLLWGGCWGFSGWFLYVLLGWVFFSFFFFKSEHRIVSGTAAQPRFLVTEGYITCFSQSPWKRI